MISSVLLLARESSLTRASSSVLLRGRYLLAGIFDFFLLALALGALQDRLRGMQLLQRPSPPRDWPYSILRSALRALRRCTSTPPTLRWAARQYGAPAHRRRSGNPVPRPRAPCRPTESPSPASPKYPARPRWRSPSGWRILPTAAAMSDRGTARALKAWSACRAPDRPSSSGRAPPPGWPICTPRLLSDTPSPAPCPNPAASAGCAWRDPGTSRSACRQGSEPAIESPAWPSGPRQFLARCSNAYARFYGPLIPNALDRRIGAAMSLARCEAAAM